MHLSLNNKATRFFSRDLHFVSTGLEPSTLLMFQSGYTNELNYLVAKNRFAPIFLIFFSNAIDSCRVGIIVCQTKSDGIPFRNDFVSPALCSINRFSIFCVGPI
jgi:hypothetical protein